MPHEPRHARFRIALLALSTLPFLMGAKGCGPVVAIGSRGDAGPEAPCSQEHACGPPLSIPQELCWDGSVGGNTGVCESRYDGTCRWQIRQCPPRPGEMCDPGECDGPFFVPNAAMRCERGTDGVCRWLIDESGACDVAACGGVPPAVTTYTCVDGAVGGFTGHCVRNAADVCVWEQNTCAAGGECRIEDCGATDDAATCLCADGSLGCNTRRCVRGSTGQCGWERLDCPVLQPCGGATDCGTDEVCAVAMLPAGIEGNVCSLDIASVGTCLRMPSGAACQARADSGLAPLVCGCDGVTYASDCHAIAAGVRVQHPGACAARCGGPTDVVCPSGQFCAYPSGGACGANGAMGLCETIPAQDACTGINGTVCGCNGTTYASECIALAAGTTVDHAGDCVVGANCMPQLRACGDRPACPAGTTPEISNVDSCFTGECVPLLACGCTADQSCPASSRCNLATGRCVAR